MWVGEDDEEEMVLALRGGDAARRAQQKCGRPMGVCLPEILVVAAAFQRQGISLRGWLAGCWPGTASFSRPSFSEVPLAANPRDGARVAST